MSETLLLEPEQKVKLPSKKLSPELREMKKALFGKKKIKMSYLTDDQSILQFLVTFSIGFGALELPEIQDRFRKALQSYVREMKLRGYTPRKVDILVRRATERYRFGFEVSRICRRFKA